MSAYEGLSVAGRRQVLGGTFGVVWVAKGRGPATERVKVSDLVPDLPRPGFGRFAVEPIGWDDVEEPSWVLRAKGAFEG